MPTTFDAFYESLQGSLGEDLSKLEIDVDRQELRLVAPDANHIAVTIAAAAENNLTIKIGDAVEFTTPPNDPEGQDEAATALKAALAGDIREETWRRDGALLATRLICPGAQWTEAKEATVMTDDSSERSVLTYQPY
ncbi:hypothetical protein GCM10009744_18560 [Kribbella alba]|uniref:Amphi-Trp domain-containing protein n=2 Tax=Kribbella alba TaxID=190197 RepID=A0ABP4R314_9ACTN